MTVLDKFWMTAKVEDDTTWIEKAMDEYHGCLRPESNQPRRWKFSDLNQTLQSIMCRRAAELKKEGR